MRGGATGCIARIHWENKVSMCSYTMCACRDMSGYIGICLVMLGLCRDMMEYTGICLDMLGNPGICQDM